MSSRARLVDGAARVERFAWPVVPAPDGGGGAPVLLPPVEAVAELPAPAAGAVPGPPPQPSPAEQQSHLAALEREAFGKGYAQGERAGIEAGTKRTDAMLRRIAQTLDDLGRLRAAIVRDTERQMVQLALSLARRIVHREVTLDPTLVAAMAHVAVARLGESAPATIKLHPDDYAVISALRGDQWEGPHVAVLPDPAVSRGGCVVESSFGTVDGSLDAQFDEMARALLGDPPPADEDAARHGR
jgi:flagellar assembly protein FliH